MLFVVNETQAIVGTYINHIKLLQDYHCGHKLIFLATCLIMATLECFYLLMIESACICIYSLLYTVEAKKTATLVSYVTFYTACQVVMND